MPKSIKVSKSEIDDDFFIKSQKVRINDKKFVTPIKSIDMSNLRRDIHLNDCVKGLNEVFRTFNHEKLDKFVTGKDDETDKIHKPMNTKFNKTAEDEVNLCFTLYESPNLPEGKSINLLTNTAYQYSDATPLPLLTSFFQDEKDFIKQFDEYIIFMNNCIESINRLNNKPIIGVIPIDIPSMFVADLIDFYHDNDITSFVYDFKGKVYAGNESKLREMIIALKELEILDDAFLYTTNVNPGKMLKGTPIIRATDLLLYNFGFDAIGDNHIRRKYPKEVLDKMKERVGPKSIRLLNSQDYGYYKTSNMELLTKFYPKDETTIPFETFEVDNNKAKQCQKLFNAERIGLETSKYQTMIKEHTEISDYIGSKDIVRDKDLKILYDFRKDIELK